MREQNAHACVKQGCTPTCSLLQNTFVSIVQALTVYYNTVLTVAFWANSFENDLSTGINTCAFLF